MSTSQLAQDGHGSRLGLVTGAAMTPQGLIPALEPGTTFFSGFVTRPDVLAAGLLAVADIAGSRYADLGVTARIKAADPVVTAGGDRLRFESFSLCNGVYACFDLLPEGLGTSEVGFGTTNVDVNQPLRTALARVNRDEPLHLAVGPDELRTSSLTETHVEPKVALPDRWVRGLAETARLLHEMSLVATSTGVQARRFFTGPPRVAAPGPELHVLPLPTGWRTTSRPNPASIPIFGATRLRGADRVLRHTTRLAVHRHPGGSTAWVLDLPGSRLTLAFSPGLYRGFSGEGTLLALLAHPEAETSGRRLQEHLGWTATIDPGHLARTTGLGAHEVEAGLNWLSASGRVGYDLDAAAWFHRDLPVDSEAVIRRNPRITAALRLVEASGVRLRAAGSWEVDGTREARYEVTTSADSPSGLRCSCLWETEHAGTRGPCKHILAVLIDLRVGRER